MNKPHKPEPLAFDDLPDISERPAFFGTGKLYPRPEMSDEERAASWQRFLDGANAGYCSDGTKLTRDEMNERWSPNETDD